MSRPSGRRGLCLLDFTTNLGVSGMARAAKAQQLKLEIKEEFTLLSERVYSVDEHPAEPWILTSLNSGTVCIWNYSTQTLVGSVKVTGLPVRSAKFIARKQWVVAGADDKVIHVYNYSTMDMTKEFEAHTNGIRCVAVHPTLPYVLSSSDDMLIKLWDWENGWLCIRTFKGHSNCVMQVTFNPRDTHTFASASLDDTIKVWDYETKSCVQTLEGHTHNVSAVCFLPGFPIIITGSDDGNVRIWHAASYRLEYNLNYGPESVWAVSYIKSLLRVIIGYDKGTIMVKLSSEVPFASMDSEGKIIWARHKKMETVNIKSVGADYEVVDGDSLPLTVEEFGTSRPYIQSLTHHPNGEFYCVCGNGSYAIHTPSGGWKQFGPALEFVWSTEGHCAIRESTSKITIFSKTFKRKKSIRPTFSVEHIYGGNLLAMCSNDNIHFYDWADLCYVADFAGYETDDDTVDMANLADCTLIWKITVNVEVRKLHIKNLYWADSHDLVTIASDTSFYILKYAREIVTKHLDANRPAEEGGVGDAFQLLYEIKERVWTGLWVGDCFIYNNSSQRLNYCIGGEVTTMCRLELDRPMYLLGYLASQSRVCLLDKEYKLVGYTLPLSVMEFRSLVMAYDMERANKVLESIPEEHCRGLAEWAAHVAPKAAFKNLRRKFRAMHDARSELEKLHREYEERREKMSAMEECYVKKDVELEFIREVLPTFSGTVYLCPQVSTMAKNNYISFLQANKAQGINSAKLVEIEHLGPHVWANRERWPYY
ncbi:Coatomer [Perilla frutescens var. hirtella]|uniref:Beta'-coat protein n=1 Tax=Perilla frutescens var. hirtella TaxID=608512 RepID=A0AAD4IUB6_PERFH|nr:Coatomer [Perilla frutescens var. hirtella]